MTARVWTAGLLTGLVAVGAASAGEGGSPRLVSAAASGRHAAVVARFGRDDVANQIEVSTSSRITAAGFPAKAIVIREQLPNGVTGTLRYRTKGELRPGRYWVAVSAHLLGFGTCVPLRRGVPCDVAWSNTLPLHVP